MSERKLASIRRIVEISAIDGADLICAYRVDDWWVVGKVNEFVVGDLVVYFEIDSWIPTELAPFLSKGKEPRVYEGVAGERLKTIRLKGKLSQGLILPLSVLGADFFNRGVVGPDFWHKDDIIVFYEEGADCTDYLGIQKWEAPVNAQLAGKARGNFPDFIRKTGEERIQNFGKEVRAAFERGDRFEVTMKLDGCFGYKTYLPLWAGGTVMIGDIVSKNLTPTLIGMDVDGNIVPCEVTGRFNNGTRNNWVDIFFTPTHLANKAGKSGRLRVTDNHKIFLNSHEEISVANLKIGDEIITYDYTIDDIGIHYIKSSLLGDGCICGKHKKHNKFFEGHKNDHSNFIDYIATILSPIVLSVNECTSGYGSSMLQLSTKHYNILDSLRKEWYPDGKKVLPHDISWIDDFSVAKMYMDDGSLSHTEYQNDRANISTHTFSSDDVDRLMVKIIDMYGVDCVKQSSSKGHSLRINYSNGSIHRFWNAIAPHIHEDFKYKLPEEYRCCEFVKYPSANEIIIPVYVKVLNISTVENTKHNFPSGRVGFDIETTTHNYMAGGILVHNSSCTAYYNEGQLGVCSRNINLTLDQEGNAFIDTCNKHGLLDALAAFGKNIAVQSELMGPGIQKNREKFDSHKLFPFKVWDIDAQRYLAPAERHAVLNQLGELGFKFDHVPVLDDNFMLYSDSVAELLPLADGPSINHKIREGVVLKRHDGNLSFKIISNKFLLKEEE